MAFKHEFIAADSVDLRGRNGKWKRELASLAAPQNGKYDSITVEGLREYKNACQAIQKFHKANAGVRICTRHKGNDEFLIFRVE